MAALVGRLREGGDCLRSRKEGTKYSFAPRRNAGKVDPKGDREGSGNKVVLKEGRDLKGQAVANRGEKQLGEI